MSNTIKSKKFFDRNDTSKLIRVIDKGDNNTYQVSYLYKDGANTISEDKLLNDYCALKPYYVISLHFILENEGEEYDASHNIIISINRYPVDNFKDKEIPEKKVKWSMIAMIDFHKLQSFSLDKDDPLKDIQLPLHCMKTCNSMMYGENMNLDGSISIEEHGYNSKDIEVIDDMREVAYGYIDDDPVYVLSLLMRETVKTKCKEWLFRNYQGNGNSWCLMNDHNWIGDILDTGLYHIGIDNIIYNIINVIPMRKQNSVPPRYTDINLFVRDLDRYITKVPPKQKVFTSDFINVLLTNLRFNCSDYTQVGGFEIDYDTMKLCKYSPSINVEEIRDNIKSNEVLLILRFNSGVLLLKYSMMDSFQLMKKTGKSPLSNDEMQTFLKKKF